MRRPGFLAALLVGGLVFTLIPARARAGDVSPEEQMQLSDAMQLYNANRWSEGEQALRAFLKAYPWSAISPEARYRHAVCLNRLGYYQRARSELQWFLEHAPTSLLVRQANIELAYALMKMGSSQEATETLRAALPALTPGDRLAEAVPLAELETAVSVPAPAPRAPPPVAPAPATSHTILVETSASQTVAHPSETPVPVASSAARSDIDELHRLEADVRAQGPSAMGAFEHELETRATFFDVVTLYAEGDTANAGWGLIAAKMARIYLHLGDLPQAQQAAERALQAGAGGYRDAVQAVLDRVALSTHVDPTLVGAILPLTGRFKPYGDKLQNGLNLALGSGAGNVHLLVRDSEGDPEKAVAAVEDLARQGAVVILGPVGTQEAMPAAVRAQELGIPMISLSRAEGVTQAGDFIFRNSLTNSAQGRGLARYAAEVLNAKRAAILAPDIAAGQEVTTPFWSGFESEGGEVRGYETYAQDQTTFSEPLRRLVIHGGGGEEMRAELDRINATIKSPFLRKKAIARLSRNAPPIIDFDVLLVPDYYKAVLQLAPAIAVEDVITNGCDEAELKRVKATTHREDIKTVTLLGTAGWNSPDLIARGGRYVECAVIVDGFYVNSSRDETKQFVSSYRERFNTDPGLLEAQAYDTMRIVRQILDRRPASREAFREDLLQVKHFPGATGDTTFAPDREADKPLFFLTVGKTGFQEMQVRISPEGVATPGKASSP